MKHIEENSEFFKRLLDMLEAQLGCNHEIALHDLTHGYEHTIVDIRNGHVTNRKIGDCGSNLGLEVLRGNVENGDRYNYITHTMGGKVLRSSTVYIRDDDGQIIGSLCMNKDITDSLKMEAYLREENKFVGADTRTAESQTEVHKGDEVFCSDVNELLEHLISFANDAIGKPVAEMNREDKIAFIDYLDQKGAFLITKSGIRVCEYLGISKFTLYNYLEVGQKSRKNPAE